MDFKTFQSNLKVLDKQTGNTIRSKYINEFVNTEHEQYHQQKQLKHKFRDGYCYVGYLWDYIKNPIIIDKDNVVVAGHTRLKAAKNLGLETVPCIRADDLTDEQIKAFRLVDNKTAELSGWDFDLLDEELRGILNIDMEDFSFDKVEDLDLDEFYEDSEPKEKEKKLIVCPHCGEPIEV